jgi:twitching motility two-component system response regulator PilH
MDVNMPEIDGFAANRMLKEDQATRDIPVVFVSGKNQKADMAWGQMLGAKGYITKPYSREQIIAQLQG